MHALNSCHYEPVFFPKPWLRLEALAQAREGQTKSSSKARAGTARSEQAAIARTAPAERTVWRSAAKTVAKRSSTFPTCAQYYIKSG